MKESNFSGKVFKIVKHIPKGSVLSYGAVARLAGSPNAYRSVGNILNKNYNPEIPCHRIVRSDGKLGGYNSGAGKKRHLLRKEKAILVADSY